MTLILLSRNRVRLEDAPAERGLWLVDLTQGDGHTNALPKLASFTE